MSRSRSVKMSQAKRRGTGVQFAVEVYVPVNGRFVNNPKKRNRVWKRTVKHIGVIVDSFEKQIEAMDGVCLRRNIL